MTIDNNAPVDVVGVGFGPSNLALAIAIEEHNERVDHAERITARFVEKQKRFGWHRGMLLPGTTMQISFLKDLATQRDVCSAFSFLKYLSERGRLIDFINQQSFFPTRLEFHDYLEWAAAKVTSPVTYGVEVNAVSWTGDTFEIQVAGAAPVRGRNVVLAGGLRSKVPDGVVLSTRVFHNHRLLEHLQELPALRHQKLIVVGAGQSAAEVASYLHETYPKAQIHAVFGKYGYTPADDSPYANRIFDPDAVVDFHQSSEEFRAQLLSYHRGTNYSAVDPPLIDELYRREYGERVAGQRRLFVRGASEIDSMLESDSGVNVQVRHRPSQQVEKFDCDAVIFATGFEPAGLSDMLGPLAGACDLDDKGRPVVDRDYRVATSGEVSGGIYLQGATEHTHGLTSTLLSNLAVRSGELVESFIAAKKAQLFDEGSGDSESARERRAKRLVYQSM